MKWAFLLLLVLALTPLGARAADVDIVIPEKYRTLIKTADFVEISGTNDLGGKENFTIHNAKAIAQFVKFLTTDRYYAAPKALKPDFKSLSAYQIRLSAKGQPVLAFRIIADSVLDFPTEPAFYVQAPRYSDNIMFPLLRLE